MPKKILIADDDPAILELLSIYAEMHGYEVETVQDGIELLQVATSGQFDVIITDLMMTEMDGATATEIIKKKGITTPVIALTGMPQECIEQLQGNFACIFKKPCDFMELFSHVVMLTD